MNPGAPSIIVVDDKDDAGLSIVKALWDEGFAVQFVQFDPARLIRIQRKKLATGGVRIVFMDINLIGGVMGAEAQNFGAIQTTLQTIIPKDNGPYLLITWSSHDDYAENLFQFLEQRLPPEIKPALKKRLSKTDYAGAKAKKLPDAIKSILNDMGFAGCLINWEFMIREAGVSTLNTLGSIARTLADDAKHPDNNTKLGAVIRAIAKAEAANHLSAESAFPALSTVLAQVLHDEATIKAPLIQQEYGTAIFAIEDTNTVNWSARVNKALHIEYGGLARMHAPGDAFLYPSLKKRKRCNLPKIDFAQFFPEHFFNTEKWGKVTIEEKKKILEEARIVLIEITPPCDHANKKLLWHRYVIGAEFGPSIPSKLLKSADNLMLLPTFLSPGEEKRILILNSRATVSIPPNDANDLGPRLYRVRSQLLSDVIRWLSGQQARLGYVYLS